MTYLNRDSAQKILNTRPAGTSVQDALKTLSDKGFTIEGYNDGTKGSINEPSTLSKIGEFGQKLAGDIVQPFENLAKTSRALSKTTGQYLADKVKGNDTSFSDTLDKNIQNVNQDKTVGSILLDTPAVARDVTTSKGLEQTAGDIGQGLLNVSTLGEGAALNGGIKTAVKTGVKYGAGYSATEAMQEGKGLKDTLIDTGKGMVIGGALGLGAGVATPIIKNVAGATKDVLGTVIKDTSAAFSKIPRATDKLATIAKESINPTVSKEKAIGEVLQGTTKDIKKASEGLNLIDTTGIKTYKELDNTINDKISTLARTVDNEFAQDTTKTILDNLTITKPTKAGGSVSVNYVDNALKQLEELYNKTGDIVSETDIRDLRNLAQTQGLTKLEINDIARTYGQEFGEKAFGKIGEPLTSVNAQLYENTRKGIKEVARNGLSSDAAKQADQAMSSLYNTRVLVKKNVEAVNKLMNRIEERGLVEKIGHSVSKYADILTGGGLRGFVGGLLPRGAGYKTLNALDLENLLERNLKIIQQASQAKTAAEVKTITSKLFTK